MIVRFTGMCIALLCIAGLLTLSAFAQPSPAHLNVKDFGAVGDSKTDDTQALLSAIEAAKARSLPVYVPKGGYIVSKPLVLDQVSMVGSEPGGWCADSGTLPWLKVAHNSGPAVIMRDASAIHGIGIMHPSPNSDEQRFEKYPPAILMDGQGLSITNVRLQYCDDGIITSETAGVGRLNIENVFIVSPAGVSLYVHHTLDIPTLRNIEVWNNLHRPGNTAFKFGRNDGLRASQLFAFHVEVGFELADTPQGGTWGVFTDCGTDACGVAWKSDGKVGHTVSLTGGYYWNHHQTLLISNPNVSMRVTGSELQSNGAPVISAYAMHHLLITGCRIGRAYVNPGVPYFDLHAVNSLTMSSCVVGEFSPLFNIGEGVKRAAITGNVFDASPFERIVSDNRAEDAEIIMSDNAGMKPTPAETKR